MQTPQKSDVNRRGNARDAWDTEGQNFHRRLDLPTQRQQFITSVLACGEELPAARCALGVRVYRMETP
eukprot:scaffold5014_cov387-Prasinococcus_capsulatus_cf.AAC.14